MIEIEQRRLAAERARSIRALLHEPMLTPAHAVFGDARRHREWLRAWFARECGWPLIDSPAVVRLRKQGLEGDSSRGAELGGIALSRRRYVLLCLALAGLERAESQITLGNLAQRLLGLAGDPKLVEAGIEFTLGNHEERRDLAAVAKLLLGMGVLKRVAGDEQSYVHGSGDALYDVDRHVLSATLAVTTGPSLVNAQDIYTQIAAVSTETFPDSDDARNRAIRHRLSRRLLDDPVMYYDELDSAETEYLTKQRPHLLRRLTEETGLVAEVRAEGIALLDPNGETTDYGMPEEGTEGHITLLVAEQLARIHRETPNSEITQDSLLRHLIEIAPTHRTHWKKDATKPENLKLLLEVALEKLVALRLVARRNDTVLARPALARYAYRPATITGGQR
ncbi:TIGR02678 family protein [Natronoglycomyces albus]|uniref:TIGR02678 family protein n=1 Tax=Natronoglycomyces albus TaxID=2811108 RepID=A0A895XPW1_9ACTN|nr:TIGR02678 family protein [Natronoglycomyces albus]QSB05145.1 TIGR02678 family protein [Natronoglycomyces albus]